MKNIDIMTLDPRELGNRFTCINQLEQAVCQKKGGYTEEERQHGLSVLYSGLKAPNCYFANDIAEMGKKEKEKLSKFVIKLGKFQKIMKQEGERYSLIYTYLSCIRDLFNNTKYSSHKNKGETCNHLPKKLQTALEQALNERIAQNPELGDIRDKYQMVLKDTFQDNQNRLNHPAFFLFLPYYLFFKLGQCEGLIKKIEKDPSLFHNWAKMSLTGPFAIHF